MTKNLPFALVTCLALVSCGGGGGGGGSSSNDGGAFAVTSVNPATGATAVSRTLTPSVYLNSALSGTSVNASDVQLLSPQGVPIPITPLFSNQSLSLNVNAMSLPGNSTYQIAIASPLANTKGQLLQSNFSSSFTTAPQKWGAPSALYEADQLDVLVVGFDETSITLSPPLQSVDQSGNVMVAWIDNGPSLITNSIEVGRYNHSSGIWSQATVLEQIPFDGSSASGTPLKPTSLISLPNGDANLAWVDSRSGGLVSVAHYSASSDNWTRLPALPILPAFAGGYSSAASLDSDSDGNLSLVYLDAAADGSSSSVVALHYTASNGAWSAPLILGTSASQAMVFRAVEDPQGNLRVFLGDGSSLMEVTYYGASQTISAPTLIESAASAGANLAVTIQDAKFASDGTLVVAYMNAADGFDGIGYLYLTTLSPTASTWSTPVSISSAYFDFPVSVTPDPAGNVLLMFSSSPVLANPNARSVAHQLTVASYNVAAHSLVAGAVVPGYNARAEIAPQLVIDVAGNSTAIWQATDVGGIFASHYSLDTMAWDSAPKQIDTGAYGMSPGLVIDGQGTATANWLNGSASSSNVTLNFSRFQ